MKIDMWTWKCLRCGWAVESARTVNSQQAVANALVRVHIQQHDADDLAALSVSPPPSEFPTEFDRLKAQKDAIVAKQRSSLFQQQILKIEELLQIANHDAQMWGLEHHDRFRKIRDMETCRTLRHVLAVLRDYPMPAAAPPEPEAAPPPSEAAHLKLELGLNVDMLDVDRLNLWANRFADYGPNVTEWGSVEFIVEKLRDIATRLEREVRDVGELRKLALSSPLPSEPKPALEGFLASLKEAIVSLKEPAERIAASDNTEELRTLWRGKAIAYDVILGLLQRVEVDSAAASPVSAVPPHEELIQMLSQRIVALEKELHQAQAENRELWALAHPQLGKKDN